MKWSCDKEDRLEWSDIEIDNRNINLGLKSIIVKSWLTPLLEDSEPVLEAAWGLNFSGLWCLGTHPVANGRLPPNSFVFQICGSYFSSASYIRGQVENNQIPRFLHIGTVDEYQVRIKVVHSQRLVLGTYVHAIGSVQDFKFKLGIKY